MRGAECTPLPRSYVLCKGLYILKERHCNFKLNLLQWQWLQYVITIAWRYQKGNQNSYIEEEQSTQWPKEKVQTNKQWYTKYIYKTKDRVTQTPLKTGGEVRCSGMVSRSCSTSGTRRVNRNSLNIPIG